MLKQVVDPGNNVGLLHGLLHGSEVDGGSARDTTTKGVVAGGYFIF